MVKLKIIMLLVFMALALGIEWCLQGRVKLNTPRTCKFKQKGEARKQNSTGFIAATDVGRNSIAKSSQLDGSENKTNSGYKTSPTAHNQPKRENNKQVSKRNKTVHAKKNKAQKKKANQTQEDDFNLLQDFNTIYRIVPHDDQMKNENKNGEQFGKCKKDLWRCDLEPSLTPVAMYLLAFIIRCVRKKIERYGQELRRKNQERYRGRKQVQN